MTGIDLTAAKNAAREALETTTTWSPMHCVDVIVDAALPHILAQVEAHVKPSREDVAQTIWGCTDRHRAVLEDAREIADAVLALFDGKTEQDVREEVAREAQQGRTDRASLPREEESF